MQIKVYLSAYNIDDFKKKWLARGLFLIMILLGILARLFPVGDSDLSGLFNFYNKMMTGEVDPAATDLVQFFKLFGGNMLYSLSLLFYDYLYFVFGIIVAARTLSEKRTDRDKVTPGAFAGRVVATLFIVTLIFPVLLSIYSSFVFIYILVIGLVIMFLMSYMSCDCTFGWSFRQGIRLYKNSLVMILMNFILFYIVFFLLENGVAMLQQNNAYETITAVLGSVVSTYKYVVFGRLAAILYLDARG